MKALPDRQVIALAILDLLSDRRSRESVADWAAEYVMNDDVYVVDDLVAWRALMKLSGADLKSSPNAYLHTEPDFHAWLDDLENDLS